MTASPVAAATVQFNPETRLYIDGRLRESATGKTADNINPATEEVLGVCTDAGAQDMEEAIAAARRAFDTTDWSTNHEFRQRCLLQLQDALEEEKEDLRAELVAEVGTPVAVTYIAQLEWPLADALAGRIHFAIRLGA
jgi:aldehyde dehydrogenase (NAD+)